MKEKEVVLTLIGKTKDYLIYTGEVSNDDHARHDNSR